MLGGVINWILLSTNINNSSRSRKQRDRLKNYYHKPIWDDNALSGIIWGDDSSGGC